MNLPKGYSIISHPESCPGMDFWLVSYLDNPIGHVKCPFGNDSSTNWPYHYMPFWVDFDWSVENPGAEGVRNPTGNREENILKLIKLHQEYLAE